MESKYPVRDCTIMDTYLIDNGWELKPIMNRNGSTNEALWNFSTMGLLARTYRKDGEIIYIGIMLSGVPIHIWHKQRFYYMPSENPDKFFEDMMAGKIECITSILYKKKLAKKHLGNTLK